MNKNHYKHIFPYVYAYIGEERKIKLAEIITKTNAKIKAEKRNLGASNAKNNRHSVL